MTDQQRTSGGTGGYRGALAPRNDRLARPWVVVVIAGFLLMFVLSFMGLPSGLFPEETPLPSVAPSISLAPSASVAPSGGAPE
ncbi:MAG: hypothetical protein ACRDHD_10765 [Candidatus Limnocylindria bacterium]